MVHYTHVYHASPESNIYRFKPTGYHKGHQSIRMNRGGIYVAPKFHDAVAWATSYVAYKKGKHSNSATSVLFRDITIYKIRIPKHILARSWSENWWEEEYFISDEDLRSIRIISEKTYDFHELFKIYKKEKSLKFELSRSRWEIGASHIHNQAAKCYLQLKEELNTLLLAGWKVDLDSARNIFRRFEPFLWDRCWKVGLDAKPKDSVTPEEKNQVDCLVKQMKQVFANGRKEH